MDYKEYSRLRSIARKRIERAARAGMGEYVRIPTVAEVRASANPVEYMAAVRTFLSDPASTLKAARQTGITLPKIDFTPLPPVTKKTLTPEERAQRRREQKRRSKAKRAVERAAANEKEARRRVGYLKALETVSDDWKKKNVDLGEAIGILSPTRAKQFVEYMEYRFSQGDFKNTYVVDTFIKDFTELDKQGYNAEAIKEDFEAFLQKEKELKKNNRKAKKYGIDSKEVIQLWKIFVKGVLKSSGGDVSRV